MRIILAPYAGVEPESLAFGAGPNGKPKLVGRGSSLAFNLSHTGDLALVAITAGPCVGIDAEVINALVEWEDLSRRFFSPAEAEEIRALPPALRVDAFFACWTRKEAFIKAVGGGLSMALDSFRVSVRPEAPACLIWAGDGRGEPVEWRLEDLSEPGMAAAVATRQSAVIVRRFDFTTALGRSDRADQLGGAARRPHRFHEPDCLSASRNPHGHHHWE